MEFKVGNWAVVKEEIVKMVYKKQTGGFMEKKEFFKPFKIVKIGHCKYKERRVDKPCVSCPGYVNNECFGWWEEFALKKLGSINNPNIVITDEL